MPTFTPAQVAPRFYARFIADSCACIPGRGKKPKWVEHWLAEGGTLDDLAIAQRCDKTMELPGVTASESQPSA